MSDMIVVPREGRLAAMVVKVPYWLRTLTLHLYQNDYSPDVLSVVGDFDECDFPGYTAQSLNDFGDPYINADDEAESDSSVHTWVCTDVPAGGSQRVYGWYTTDALDAPGPCARMVNAVPPDGVLLTGPDQSVSVQIFFEDGELREEE